MRNVRGRQDDACVSKFTNEPEVWYCNVQPQFRTPDQIIHCQDYNCWDQRKFLDPCNVAHEPYRYCKQAKNTYADEASRYVPSCAEVCSSELAKTRY